MYGMRWLRFRIWLVGRLGGDTEYLDEELWRRSRPPSLPSRAGESVIDMSDANSFTSMLMELQAHKAAREDPLFSYVAPTIEWLEDEAMPRLTWYFEDPADDWGFPSTWDDTPRKPQFTMQVNFGYKYAYGIIVRNLTTGEASRYLGGNTWEKLG